ncbi:conserved protein of unknown function [Modestobacter italicus]|uniref:Uncharacterized protein n=1 Tax=Modestobacter italicus (strain DSM 44449 / CECT 9708 / BC 501) TaxID=2732864 RepID=I4F0K4_MODI5|nr:hypothetical protein [Modestobacter marinus]CCH89167.1 conserved protein of unknown function [Modestobacter marinus]
MNPDLHLTVPAGFDDADADAQVHPIARLLFTARTNAEAFGKAQKWVSVHDVFLVDVSWDFVNDESEPFTLSIYFVFEEEP